MVNEFIYNENESKNSIGLAQSLKKAFGDFRPGNHTFCSLLIITLMVAKVGNCHYIGFVWQYIGDILSYVVMAFLDVC